MKDLMNSTDTMSSLEIAELTGKRHDHVMRDIENVLKEVGLGAPKFGGTYLDNSNRQSKCYNLDKELTLTLVSGYNIKMRYAIIRRWQELESAKPQPKPMSRIELAREQLRLQIEVADAKERAKKAQRDAIRKLEKIGNHLAGSTISEIGDCVTFNEASKILASNLEIKLSHNKLMALCRSNGWLMTGERSPSEYNHPTELKIHHMRMMVHQKEVDGAMLRTVVIRPSGLVQLARLIPIWITDEESIAPPPPPPPPPKIELLDDRFTLQDYYKVGWTDKLLIEQNKAKYI